jgi:hypothetical protein
MEKALAKKRPKWLLAILLLVYALAAVTAPVVQYACRVGWVFINHEVKLAGLAEAIWVLMMVNGLCAVYITLRYFYGWRSKAGNIATGVIFGFSLLFTLFFQLMNWIMSIMARQAVVGYYWKKSFPVVLALVAVPLLLLCWSSLKNTKTKKMISAALAALFVAVLVFQLIPAQTPRLAGGGPMVLDTGDGYYSVVFATDREAQGFVRYTYRGKEKEIYSRSNIVRKISQIHAVKIPREELENNSYTIFARKVNYGMVAHVGASNYGKTVRLKEPIHFKGSRAIRNPNVLALSDWHEQMGVLKRTVEAFPQQADLALLLGDYCNWFASEDDIIKTIIGGGYIATKGEIPAIFVRGNHEVRGTFMGLQDLDRMLGLNSFYYEVRRGNYVFTVMDTAEATNWEHDNWEHVGQYSQQEYFADQLDWLESLPPAQDGQTRIVLQHDTHYIVPEATVTGEAAYVGTPKIQTGTSPANLSKRFKEIIKNNGTALIAGGHGHVYTLELDWDGTGVARFEDGGTGTVPHTGYRMGQLTLLEGKASFTGSFLHFGSDKITITGKIALGESEKIGGVDDTETLEVPR